MFLGNFLRWELRGSMPFQLPCHYGWLAFRLKMAENLPRDFFAEHRGPRGGGVYPQGQFMKISESRLQLHAPMCWPFVWYGQVFNAFSLIQRTV